MSGNGELGSAVGPAFSERIVALRQELAFETYQTKDPYIEAYSNHVYYALETNEKLTSTIDEALQKRPGVSGAYAGKLILRSLQAIEQPIRAAQEPERPSYPQGLDEPDNWAEVIDHALNEGFTPFYMNLRREVQSNIADRGKVLAFLAPLLGIADNLTVMDVGCSQNQVLKQLDSYTRPGQGFSRTEIVVPEETEHGRVKHVRDREATDAFNDILRQRPIKLAEGVGVDLQSPFDPLVRQWARSCSLYPSECADPSKIRRFDRLAAQDPAHVKFLFEDYVKFDKEYFEQKFGHEPAFGAVLFSTVLYQRDEEEIAQMIDHAKHSLRSRSRGKPGGKIIIQDFVDIDENEHMTFHDDMPPYSYKVWVWDSDKSELGWQHYMTANNGRVDKLRLEKPAQRLINRTIRRHKKTAA